MRLKKKSHPWTYGAAFLIPALACAIQELFQTRLANPFPFFLMSYPAVFFVAWLGGVGPGLIATVVAALGSLYLFIPPYHSLAVANLTGGVSLGVFVLMGISFSTLIPISQKRRIAVELDASEQELRTSEERLRLALTFAEAGIWEWDLTSGANVWSETLWKLYGLEPDNGPASYDLWRKTIHPGDVRKTEQAVQDAARAGSEISIEWRVIGPTGSERWLMSRGQPIRDSSGRTVRYLGIVLDVTKRKYLETDLRAAVEARDDFLSIASHELKTPLTALQLQLQLMRRMASNEPALLGGRMLTTTDGAVGACKRLTKLLDELLDLTRIRAGKLKLEKQELDLVATMMTTVSRMSAEATQAGNEVTVHGETPVKGMWDPVRIDQIISNLLSNAIKYGNGKPIDISVTASPDQKFAKLSVEDRGPGIPPELREKIFQRFERGETGPKIAGLGLGLYIVRQIVDAHGGTIRVENAPEQGARFICELPTQPAPDLEPRHSRPSEQESTRRTSATS